MRILVTKKNKQHMKKNENIQPNEPIVENELDNAAEQDTQQNETTDNTADNNDILQEKINQLEARVAELEDIKLRKMA
jgi:uncharacterized protein YceH (UPF0502 family)